MKVLLINSMSSKGSTGRIVDGISKLLKKDGSEVCVAYGYDGSTNPSSKMFGFKSEQFIHKCLSHAFDMQGLGSIVATCKLINFIKNYKPDIINIHTIHGNYLNYPLLFNYLKEYDGKVVWTLHDCWTFTGHCPHFEFEGCYKWRTECHDCPQLKMYPASDFWDGSRRNFKLKKKFFTAIKSKLTIVAVSHWLANYARQSFFKDVDVRVLHNGINFDMFKRSSELSIREVLVKYGIPSDKKIVLAVASPWTERKGFSDLLKISELLSGDYQMVIVGLSQIQKNQLPDKIIGILRTESVAELANIYSASFVLVNPTYEDCFPTVNLESLICGTPIITYNTGGSPEAIDEKTGIVVEQGNYREMADAIMKLSKTDNKFSPSTCIAYAQRNFNEENALAEYIALFHGLNR